MEGQEILKDIIILVQNVTEKEVNVSEDTFVRNTQLNVGEECLDLSSLELIEFVILLEEKYGIHITNEDILEFQCVADIIKYVQTEISLEQIRMIDIESASRKIFGE